MIILDYLLHTSIQSSSAYTKQIATTPNQISFVDGHFGLMLAVDFKKYMLLFFVVQKSDQLFFKSNIRF